MAGRRVNDVARMFLPTIRLTPQEATLRSHTVRRTCACQLHTCNHQPAHSTLSLSPTHTPPPLPSKQYQQHPHQQLMLRAGMMQQSSAGVYALLPLGLRMFEKVQRIVDEELHQVGGQKMALPCLTPAALWQQSGRWQAAGAELMRLEDRRGHAMCIAPTCEETVTEAVARCGPRSSPFPLATPSSQLTIGGWYCLILPLPASPSFLTSHRQLPVRLYQLDRKFRDEVGPQAHSQRIPAIHPGPFISRPARERGSSAPASSG